MPWVGKQCVIVVFPDHTHLFFFPFRTTIVQLDIHKFAIKITMNTGLIDDQSNLETCLSINLI